MSGPNLPLTGKMGLVGQGSVLPVSVSGFSNQDMNAFLRDTIARTNTDSAKQSQAIDNIYRSLAVGQQGTMNNSQIASAAPLYPLSIPIKCEQIKPEVSMKRESPSQGASSQSAMSTRTSSSSHHLLSRAPNLRSVLQLMAEENEVMLTDNACDLLSDHLAETLEYLTRQAYEVESNNTLMPRKKAEIIIYHAMVKYAGFERYPFTTKRKEEEDSKKISGDTKRARR